MAVSPAPTLRGDTSCENCSLWASLRVPESVGAKTGTPGKGFIAAENVPLEQAAVFEWSWLDRSPANSRRPRSCGTRLPSNGKSLEDLKREVTESAG